MPRKGISGTGITAREVTLYDVQRGESLPKSFWEGITESFKKHGHFGMVALEAEEICNQVLANFKGDMAPVDSPEAFAQIILKHIAIAKDNIGHRDDADYAARHAFEAGVEWARAMMKWQWELDALRGQKVAGGERNAAHQTNRRHDKLREARFARMAELVPGIGVDKAAAQCEVEGLGKRTGIKRQWYRHHPKKSDT
ncbi:MAG: hypothetical protein WBA29_04000 [Xanthobacteraceae bacterium]